MDKSRESLDKQQAAQMGYEPRLVAVFDVIKKIPQQGQVQYDLQRQLRELRIAANKLGLHDAANFIRPYCD